MGEEGDTQMTDTQLPPPPLDAETANKEEIKGNDEYPVKINAEEEKEMEKIENPVTIEVERVKEGETQRDQVENSHVEEDKQNNEIEYLNVKQQEEKDEDKDGPPPGWDSPPLPLPPQQEMGQMICGSCRRLLSYPQGSKHVRCSCCLTVNYVLEEHQVGQVKCGSCAVLLMYPFGAQSVRCCSCCSVISTGDHNKRPPLSVQQSRACRPFNIGH